MWFPAVVIGFPAIRIRAGWLRLRAGAIVVNSRVDMRRRTSGTGRGLEAELVAVADRAQPAVVAVDRHPRRSAARDRALGDHVHVDVIGDGILDLEHGDLVDSAVVRAVEAVLLADRAPEFLLRRS